MYIYTNTVYALLVVHVWERMCGHIYLYVCVKVATKKKTFMLTPHTLVISQFWTNYLINQNCNDKHQIV